MNWKAVFWPQRKLAQRVITVSLLAVIVFFYLLRPAQINGASMAPDYKHGQTILICKFCYWFSQPVAEDVIAIRLAGERVMIFSRVVGMPGDSIAVKGKIIYINGYAKNLFPLPTAMEREPFTLKSNEYYLLGNGHLSAKKEERETVLFGIVSKNRIVGKVVSL
jgi:signal peptidase I